MPAREPPMPTTNITIFRNGRTEHAQLSVRPTPRGEAMSTSQIPLLRLAQEEDAYIPGTLNPRQYQGLARVWGSGDTFAERAYNPTVTDQRAATALPTAINSKSMALLEDWEDWGGWDEHRGGHIDGQTVGLEKASSTAQTTQLVPSMKSTSTGASLALRLSPVKSKR
jgi:hypothetical protein